jgi:hypothetical protein
MNVTTALALSRAGTCFGPSSMRAGHLARRVNSRRGTDVNDGSAGLVGLKNRRPLK